jgi:DNA-binding transcriptional ArsR family regulator
MKPSDLLLHPVRLRIVQTFLGGRRLTTAELREELVDVAPATLYRQVGALVDGKLLEVVEERKVRGTFERTYQLREDAALLSADDAREMSEDEHRRGFLTFVAGVLGDYDRYLDGEDIDFARDLVGYRQAAFNLTDEETMELVTELRDVLATRAALPPGSGRRRRILTTILMPNPS